MKSHKEYIKDCEKIKLINANLPEVEKELNVDEVIKKDGRAIN